MKKGLFKNITIQKSWSIPYAIFLFIFVVIPLLLIAWYAFTNADGQFTLDNFKKFIHNSETVNTFVYSVGIAILTTIICILIGYPVAYILSKKNIFNSSSVIVMLFILPMWINTLLRTLATVALFDFLNLPLGEGALIFGLVYNFLPFMIYPIYNTLTKLDNNLIEAAQDLGASPVQVFKKATLPLSMPGITSGILMVFMPTVFHFCYCRIIDIE